MDHETKGILDGINGLQSVDTKMLEEFKRVMTEHVIPEIVDVVEKRRLAAAESRHWQLKS